MNHNNIINKYKILKFTNKNIGSHIDEIDPIFKLINNFEEINILLNKNPDKFKFIYFNKTKIKQILYDCEKEIILDSDKIENTLDKIFYLSLLVTDNMEIVNYKYSIDYIKQLNELNEKNNLKYSKIIFSKIILDLIEYFIGFDEYNLSIDTIKQKNIDIINYNNIILKEFKLENNFINKSIDEIYCDIIKILLHESKDYKNIYNVINQLNLEKIDITNSIFKEISKMLSSDKSIIKKKIKNINDFFDEDKIEFYYILLKYILKNICYIYQIPFLIETRTFILKNIKFIKTDNNNKEKLEYLINKLIGSKYYSEHFGIKIIPKNKNNDCTTDNNKDQSEADQKMNENYQSLNDNSIGKYFQINENENQQQIQNLSTSHETSKEQMSIEEYIKKISFILEEISISYQNNKNVNEIIMIYYLKEKQNIKKVLINFNDLIALKNYENLFEFENEQFIKYSSFVMLVNFIQKIVEYISTEYKNKNFFIISLKLEHEKFLPKKNKNGIYNINCQYGFYSKNKSLDLNYKDENILINGFNQGFLSLLCEINEFLIKFGNII